MNLQQHIHYPKISKIESETEDRDENEKDATERQRTQMETYTIRDSLDWHFSNLETVTDKTEKDGKSHNITI